MTRTYTSYPIKRITMLSTEYYDVQIEILKKLDILRDIGPLASVSRSTNTLVVSYVPYKELKLIRSPDIYGFSYTKFPAGKTIRMAYYLYRSILDGNRNLYNVLKNQSVVHESLTVYYQAYSIAKCIGDRLSKATLLKLIIEQVGQEQEDIELLHFTLGLFKRTVEDVSLVQRISKLDALISL